jgi:hypothetical protein
MLCLRDKIFLINEASYIRKLNDLCLINGWQSLTCILPLALLYYNNILFYFVTQFTNRNVALAVPLKWPHKGKLKSFKTTNREKREDQSTKHIYVCLLPNTQEGFVSHVVCIPKCNEEIVVINSLGSLNKMLQGLQFVRASVWATRIFSSL